MNTRLKEQYDEIRSSNRERFLSNDLILDADFGKPIWGVLLIMKLNQEVQDVIAHYQNDLEKLEPGNFTFPPQAAQHCTFNQVVLWSGEYKLGTQKTWESIQDAFLPAFEALDEKYPKFEITFSELIATSGGIIWCGYDAHDELENMREEFFKLLPFPAETTKKVHITHTTVARYKNKLSNPNVVLEYTVRRNDMVPMVVDKIILRNETVFPSMEYQDLTEINLT